MKKLLLILMTACLVIPCLAGCGKKDEMVLGKYKGLTYENKTFEVSDEDFNDLIDQILGRYTTYDPIENRKGTAVKKGDLVNIDFSGVLDGETEPFKGGTDKGYILEIGGGRFIPGFEDGLIGVKQGETVDLKLTFPEQYYAEYAGKKVTFTVTVNDIVEKKVPAFDDALVTDYSNGQFKTVEAYKEFASEYIIQAKAQTYLSEVRNTLLEQIVSDTKFGKLDSEKIDGYYNDIKNYYANEAMKNNMTLENYLSATYNTTVDEFNAQIMGVAEQNLKKDMVLNAIISAEKIVLTDEQYSTMVKEYMDRYKYEDQAKFEAAYGKEKLREDMLQNLALKVIMDNAIPQ